MEEQSEHEMETRVLSLSLSLSRGLSKIIGKSFEVVLHRIQVHRSKYRTCIEVQIMESQSNGKQNGTRNGH